MTNKTDLLPPAGTTHTIKPEHSKSPLWNVIKALGGKCFYYNGTQWLPVLDENYLDYYLKFYDPVQYEEIPTETPEEAEAFNKMKPYEFDEHVSGAIKVPSEKMKVALKEDSGDGFVSRCMVIHAKPVFTQAMADAGEMPPVGSEFSPPDSEDNIHTCLGYTSKNKIVGEPTGGGMVSLFFIEEIKPQDTRTSKQKAVDAVLAEWPVADAITLGVAYDVWNK